MKKFAKLSIATAVAIASMQSVNASSLEEAIENVEISGYVRYRFTERKEDKKASRQENDYDVELEATVPVNDMINATAKVVIDGDLEAKQRANGKSDDDVSLELEKLYFTYTNEGVKVYLGKQEVPSPFVDNDEVAGSGVVAAATLGPVTLAGAYFNGSNLSSETDFDNIALAGAMTSFEMVDLAAWYGIIDKGDRAYFLSAGTEVGPMGFAVSYGDRDIRTGEQKGKDASSLIVSAETSFDIFGLSAGYANFEGKGAAFENDDNADAIVNDFSLEGEDVHGLGDDVDAWKVGVNVDATSNVNLAVDYLSAEYDEGGADKDYTEVLLTAVYKMSKNFRIKTWYSIQENDNTDQNKGRLEVRYSF